MLAGALGALTPGQSATGSADTICAASATPLMFGVLSGEPRLLEESSASIEVTCETLSEVPISLSVELEPLIAGLPVEARSTEGHKLRYALFIDPARTRPFDGSFNGRITAKGSVARNQRFQAVFTVYARVTQRSASMNAGSYFDQVQIRLTY
jgi:spore coat protein U-like protein